MPVYEFEIPEEVAAWILTEKKTQPATYIQNALVDPIIKEYEKSLGKNKRQVADEEAKAEAIEVKKKTKLKEKAK